MELLRAERGPIVVNGLVLAETCYLLARYGGAPAESRFLRSLTSPRFRVEPITSADLARMADLVEQYAELSLGGTDASLIALAERLHLDTIATLDRRHFTVVRPVHVSAFVLVP